MQIRSSHSLPCAKPCRSALLSRHPTRLLSSGFLCRASLASSLLFCLTEPISTSGHLPVPVPLPDMPFPQLFLRLCPQLSPCSLTRPPCFFPSTEHST